MGHYWRALTARVAVVVVPACLVVTVLGDVASAAVTPRDPSSPRGVVLGIHEYSDLLVDVASGHILISDGSSVDVIDLAGTPVESITGLAGASDLVQDPATGTVYAALTSGAGIAAIDPASLEVTVLSTGAGSCPAELAVDQGVVWAHDSCSLAFWSLDPADGSVVAVPNLAMSVVEMATGPALPGRLFVGRGESDPRVFAYDTSARTLTQVATRAGGGAWRNDIAVSPDGQRLAWASGFLRTSDLSAVLGSTLRPAVFGAMAYRADGAIAISDSSWIGGAGPDGRTPFKPEPVVGWIVHAGIAWVGTTAYAIAEDGGTFRLFARELGFRTTTRLRSDRTRYYRHGARAVLTATLRGADPGDVVRVFAQREGGRRKLIARGPVDARGVLTTSYRMVRATAFTAEFAGDPLDQQHPSKSEAFERGVRQTITATARGYAHMAGSVAVYRPGNRAEFAIRVRPTYSRNCVTADVEAKIGGRWRPVAVMPCHLVSGSGRLVVYLGYDAALRGRPLRFLATLYPYEGHTGVANTPWQEFRFGA